MIRVPFTKLHGAENDFLLTWKSNAPDADLPEVARRICARNTGIGGDGWMLVEAASNHLVTRLFNADGSEPEISGNGTRCAAAFALHTGILQGPAVSIVTGAGRKELRLLEQSGNKYLFEMEMGAPSHHADEVQMNLLIAGRPLDVTVLNVGNPQCAVFVDSLPDDWRVLAAEIESHPRFPNRTNVSFVTVGGRHDIEVSFFERGVGETKSSGTGSTGAALAAILRNVAESPVRVHTPAGELTLRWDDSVYLTGPAEMIGEGEFFLDS